MHPVREEGEAYFLVSFSEEVRGQPREAFSSSSAAGDRHSIELELDLASTRKELESTIQELDASREELATTNEEAMSVIEEFQSTNEELETSKEELQSLNEELTTLNGQLQENVDQKLKALDDLQNIMNSSDVATLFLDRQFKIRFFTPSSNHFSTSSLRTSDGRWRISRERSRTTTFLKTRAPCLRIYLRFAAKFRLMMAPGTCVAYCRIARTMIGSKAWSSLSRISPKSKRLKGRFRRPGVMPRELSTPSETL